MPPVAVGVRDDRTNVEFRTVMGRQQARRTVGRTAPDANWVSKNHDACVMPRTEVKSNQAKTTESGNFDTQDDARRSLLVGT
jgi:hypothetical protein